MEIQALSVCVPAGCPNKCAGCVSRMHDQPYKDIISNYNPATRKHYVTRMEFARDNDCNTATLTGTGEPLMNYSFLKDFFHWNRSLQKPFRWIELQTSGVGLNSKILDELRDSGVSTISLSIWDIFDDKSNQEIMQMPEKSKYKLNDLCADIKDFDFNLRLSLNMSSFYHSTYCSTQGVITYPVDPLTQHIRPIFKKALILGADQITFRKLYKSEKKDIPQDRWIEEHQYLHWDDLHSYIEDRGRALEVLPFGAIRYSVDGISTVLDSDCMSTQTKHSLKYLILRPNCKLYTKWDDPGSLLF